MKPNTLFKRAYNRGLARLGTLALGSDLGSEPFVVEGARREPHDRSRDAGAVFGASA